jgi:integration host factor subunit alpha
MAQKTITRRDLSEAVYKAVRLSRTQSAAIVEAFFKEIAECLERGEPVRLSSFGSFVVREARQRMGRNPKTGKQVEISARRVMVFKPSAVLKARINSIAEDDPNQD